MKDNEFVSESKYNNHGPIDLDTIPIDECEMALEDFSNGSVALQKCLRAMWQKGIKTYSSYPGNNHIYDIAYIIMAENEDIFCYLSEELLNDDQIRISIVDNKEVLRFAGNQEEKEGAMILLAQDILTGKKNNKALVKEKIGQPFPDSWIREFLFNDLNKERMNWGRKVLIKKK